MNDPSKRDSLLFPIAPAASNKSVVAHDNGLEDGIAVTSSTIAATGELTTGIGGLIEWIKMANHLSNVGAEVRGDSQALVADMFDEGVSGILSLPLKGILPFLPILLGKSTPHFREKVLMDINVKLKTDEDLQQQLLLMKKSWADALLELSLTCSVGVELVDATNGGEDQGDDENCGRAYSVDASKTGEDLVLDTIVSLLCMAMSNPHGWRSFTHLLLALKGIQSELYREPLNWTCRVVGIVLQRMARSRTILSRTLAENAQRLLFLVHESLLILPLKPVEVATDKYSWSDAQLFLFNAVLDVCARLIESTHKLHRVGLFLDSRSCKFPAGTDSWLDAACVYESVPTRDVFLRALVDLRRAMVVHKKEELLVLLRRLTLRICTSGSFDEELGVAGLSVHELGGLTEQQAVEVTLDALALAINDTELHEREEVEDMVPYFPIVKELQRPQEFPDTDEAEKKFSSVDYADDSERVLWAARSRGKSDAGDVAGCHQSGEAASRDGALCATREEAEVDGQVVAQARIHLPVAEPVCVLETYSAGYASSAAEDAHVAPWTLRDSVPVSSATHSRRGTELREDDGDVQAEGVEDQSEAKKPALNKRRHSSTLAIPLEIPRALKVTRKVKRAPLRTRTCWSVSEEW
ncbi:hypothetical protein GN244_ATG17744 [Phytophthora infestans]|uniref:Uncharacterized protein n=1 Tax=Phytophthora infestans TaxID=4787 RepID=A0A833SY33_PHYIN|nr:hypothetical protein GN244_ATG17744 [Phytophthora infestans]